MRVGEFDIDAEIVGIQFQIVAFEQAGFLVDIHGERRDVAVDRELPMPIALGLGLEIDPVFAAGELAVRRFAGAALGVICVAHDMPPPSNLRCVSCFMYYNACRPRGAPRLCIIIHEAATPEFAGRSPS